ncbi:RluA family pseudouridine synthase [Agathobaculum sp.]|uniref:RluA family pseudouridine synthase n=1 Tax=Agathobaculum sp. TaxID=2048138 RepID=UPI002A83F332|nr:RluA family pseudouridine synthase [Agathobaculum sp.]MDY3618086.1 RluA family pseudouridine synthase [Agathobaculum sp.]
MTKLHLVPSEQDIGKRIDTYLSEQIEGLTRSAAQGLLAQGAVFAENKALKKNYKLTGRELLEITMPELREIDLVPENIPIDIIYEDTDIIVVNKPRGLVVHPAAGNWSGTLVNALMYHCGDSLSGINGEHRPGIVHRIDKDTSGLLVVAKNDTAHQNLAAQIVTHTARREYEAIVIGCPQLEEGTIDKPIARHKSDRKKMAVMEGGRNAITHYRILKRYSGYTHMAFQLETGRTHQIRVHMASIGHPIIGDPLYGLKKDRFSAIGGQCLHAAALTLVHPRTGENMKFVAPLPPYFTDILFKLEKMQ